MSLETLNPGSESAQREGCTCPVVDNHYGKGFYFDEKTPIAFVQNADCPLHGSKV